jgi:hypothetical protein
MRTILYGTILYGFISASVIAADPAFRAGAAAVDVTPEKFPVVVNCGFAEAKGTVAHDTLFARALVLDDGTTTLAIVVVDNCMMPREFLDGVKAHIAAELKIPTERQLIAATHTHTAPAVMGCLGADPDPAYGPFLERRIVQAVRQAHAKLAPARAGWAVVDAGTLTNNRQWILRSDKVRSDPFGNPTVRSNMHPGYQHPDFVGPSGPTDPWLSALSVQTADGKPLAVLSNFSMHYFGTPAVSADYFGRVCANLEKTIDTPGFVAIHSQGTAGDLHWMDYGKPQANPGIDKYAEQVTAKVVEALKAVKYQSNVTLAMAETKVTLGRRVPSPERLAWANKLVGELKDAKPTKQPDIYAREAVLLAAEPRRELKLQAIRIGDLGIAAIPNEVFALTGLKIKSRSPLPVTFSIELANGSEGYIPPAEQHPLGGYTTWPARTAGLDSGAEAVITEGVLTLLETVAGRKRAPWPDPMVGTYPEGILQGKPVRYWRLGDWSGPTAAGRGGDATAEPGVVFGLEGPLPPFHGPRAINRAAHFAGGRIRAKLPELGDSYTVETWLWNGFPATAREWTGTLVSLTAGEEPVDTLALGGTQGTANALAGNGRLFGKTAARFRTWHHAALVRDGARLRVYLDGALEAEDVLERSRKPDAIVIGGRTDGKFGWEGRLSEVAVYDRALPPEELIRHAKLGK